MPPFLKNDNLGKVLARVLYSQLVGTVKARKKAYSRIKNNLEYSELCQAVDFIDRSVPRKVQELLFGNPLPTDYSELGNADITFVANDIIKEINWTLVAIRKHIYPINLFLIYKESYEASFILYTRQLRGCRSILNQNRK
jgi:hypothetical protein